MILEGRDNLVIGSLKESLARHAFRHKQQVMLLQTRAIVEAIAYAGTDKISKVNETMEALLGMLVPEAGEEKERQVKRMKSKLDKLAGMGPIAVRPMDNSGFRTRRTRRVER